MAGSSEEKEGEEKEISTDTRVQIFISALTRERKTCSTISNKGLYREITILSLLLLHINLTLILIVLLHIEKQKLIF